MSLLDRVSEGFTFSLGGIQSELSGLAPSAPTIDVNGLVSATGPLGGLDASSLGSTALTLAQQGLGRLDVLRGAVSPFASVEALIGQIEGLSSAQPAQIAEQLQALSGSGGSPTLSGVISILEQLSGLPENAALRALFELVSSLSSGAVNLGPVFPQVASKVQAVVQLAQPVSAMMALYGQALSVHDTANAVSGLLSADELAAVSGRFDVWLTENGLPGRVSAVDESDPAAVAAVVIALSEYRRDLLGYADMLRRSLGFGEATLQFGAIPDALEALRSASTTLQRYQTLTPLRSLAEEAQTALMGILPASFSGVQTPVQQLKHELQNQVGTWVSAIQGMDVAGLVGPVAGAIGQLTRVISSINQALDQAAAAFRAITTQVRDVISGLNLESLAESIRTFLQPISDVLATLESLLEGSLAGVESAMTTAVTHINLAKAAALEEAGKIKGAFDNAAGQIQTALAGFPELVAKLEAGVQTVVDTLSKIQLDPFFDTAIDVMSTTADVVQAVPLEIVPDDVEADLKKAVTPIRQIRFDDLRAELLVQRDQIKEVLDEGVLGELQTLYQALLEFLTENNPRTPIEALEATVFEELLTRLRAIDPDELLRPLQEVLDQAKGFVADLDLREVVLGEIERAFDQILEFYDGLDPAALLAPVTERLDRLRTDIEQTLLINSWSDQVDAIVDQLKRLLDVLDFDALIPELERLFFPLLQDLQASPAGSPVIGTVIAAISPHPGTRPETATEVLSWVGGQPGATLVRAKLAEAAGKLEALGTTVSALPLTEIAGRATSFHRAVAQAVEARSGAFREQLRALLPSPPEELLAPVLAYAPRYAASLSAQAAQVRALAGSEFSEITSAALALREALRPLTVVQQHIAGLLRALGIRPESKTLLQILGDVLAELRPGEFLRAFQPLLVAMKQKLLSLVEQGLAVPVKDGIDELKELLDHLDVGPFVDELSAVHAALRSELDALRPSHLLGDVLTSFESLQAEIAAYDPLKPVRDVIDAFKAAVEELAGEQSPLRPTVLLEKLLEVYDEVLSLAGQLNVQELLHPVVEQLDHIFAELDDGLERSEESFVKLQDALGRIGN